MKFIIICFCLTLISCSNFEYKSKYFYRSPASSQECLEQILFIIEKNEFDAFELLKMLDSAKNIEELSDSLKYVSKEMTQDEEFVESVLQNKHFQHLELSKKNLIQFFSKLIKQNTKIEKDNFLRKHFLFLIETSLTKNNKTFNELVDFFNSLSFYDFYQFEIINVLKGSTFLKNIGLDEEELIQLSSLMKTKKNNQQNEIRSFILEMFSRLGSSEEDEHIHLLSLIKKIELLEMSEEEILKYFKSTDLTKTLGITQVTLRDILRGLRNGENLLSLIKKNLPDFESMGIEFEGSIPETIHYNDIANEIAKIVEEHYPGVKVKVESFDNHSNKLYNHEEITYEIYGVKYVYDVGDDGSLIFDDGKRGVEIASPVLRTQKDRAVHFDIINRLRNLGMDQRPDLGGIHIHYGVDGDKTSNEKMLTLFESFHKMNDQIQNVFSVNDGRSEHSPFEALETGIKWLKKRIKESPNSTVKERLRVDNEFYNRDMTGGFSSDRSVIRFVPKYGTIEFRFFNSSMDPELLELFSDFTIKLMKAWNTENHKVFDYLNDVNPGDVSIFHVAKLIDSKLYENFDELEKLAIENENVKMLTFFQKNGRELYEVSLSDNPEIDELIDGIKSYETDREIGLVVQKATHLEKENMEKLIDEVLKLDSFSEFSLQSLIKTILNTNISLDDGLELILKIRNVSRGDIFEVLVPELNKKIGFSETVKVLENEFLKNSTDLEKLFILRGIKKINANKTDLVDFIDKNFILHESATFVEEEVINIIFKLDKIDGFEKILKKIILKDTMLSKDRKKELISLLLRNQSEVKNKEVDIMLSYLLSGSQHKEIYSDILVKYAHEHDKYIVNIDKWLFIAMNSMEDDNNFYYCLEVLKIWDAEIYAKSGENNLAMEVVNEIIRKLKRNQNGRLFVINNLLKYLSSSYQKNVSEKAQIQFIVSRDFKVEKDKIDYISKVMSKEGVFSDKEKFELIKRIIKIIDYSNEYDISIRIDEFYDILMGLYRGHITYLKSERDRKILIDLTNSTIRNMNKVKKKFK